MLPVSHTCTTFCSIRLRTKTDHRKSKRDEIRKALSEEWKKVDESERSLFMKMGEEDQLRYEKEMDAAAKGYD